VMRAPNAPTDRFGTELSLRRISAQSTRANVLQKQRNYHCLWKAWLLA
jgi:hypothetical protein